MRPLALLTTLAAVAGLTAPAAAQSVVLDFESLAGPNSQQMPSYTEDGFLFTPTPAAAGTFGSHGTTSENYPGSAALYNIFGGETTILTRVGGGPFDLTRIDLCELHPTSVTVPVTFVGTRATGGTVSTTFNLDGTFGFQTFTFSEFANLSQVTWVQENQFHQFDNLHVTPVPEPAGLAAVAGLAALVLTRRRRGDHEPHSSSAAGSSSGSAGAFITSRKSTVA